MKTSDEELMKIFKYTAKEADAEIIRQLALSASTENPEKACDMIFEYILMVILNQYDCQRRNTMLLLAAKCLALYGIYRDISFEDMTEELKKVYEEKVTMTKKRGAVL